MNNIGEQYLGLKRKLFDKCYSSLNGKQREAVFTVNNPLLILAGAGSGKTTVLVKRIVYIIKYGDAYYTDYVPEFVDENYIADMQKALDSENAEEAEVRQEVRRCMEAAKEGGGYVIMPTASPINIPLSPKTERNYIAFIEEALLLGQY